MKILHVDTGKEWRGGQRQALFLHNGLKAHGHDSKLICNPDGELIKKAENTFPLKFKSEIDPFYIYKLNKIIKDFKPDVVHSHDSHSLTPCIAVAKLNKSFKLVHTRRVDFPLKKKLFNKYRSKSVTLVAISKAIKDIISESGIDPNRIEIIYSGSNKPEAVNTKIASELREKFNPDGKFVVGTIANFADHKDYPTLLKAFDNLYEKNKDIVLMAVGDGPLFDEISAMRNSLKSKDNIIFTNFCSNIPEILANMDVFTMTSKTEGLCTSIIDAMNASLPSVVTRAGGMPEVVSENETGLLYDVGDYKALADGYLTLFEDKELYKKMSANALKRAYLFSAEKMVLSYIDLYRKLIK